MPKKINKIGLIVTIPSLIVACGSTTTSKTWNGELLNLIDEYAPHLELPYFYFGDTYNSFFNDAYGAISVVTNYTNASLIDEAKAAFEKDEYDWKVVDNTNIDGYPSYTFSVIHDDNNYDIDLYIKTDFSRMEIYCYPYYDDEIKEFLKEVDTSFDVNINSYSQNYEELSNLYTALEMAGDIADSTVTLIDGTVVGPGDLDYYSKTITNGTRYDDCVYYAVGNEYKIYAGYSEPAYDSEYKINHYLNEYGLLECTWFEDYLGHGEYKNRELGYDIDLWNEYKKMSGLKTDYEFFSNLLNLGQVSAYMENEIMLKIMYGDDMITSVTHNLDGSTTCSISITINETWRESFGIYGIEQFPGLTEDMDAPFIDEYVSEAIFDANNVLTSLKTCETQKILASQVTDVESPWYGKEDFVVSSQIDEQELQIIEAPSFEGELLFNESMTATASLGTNGIRCYESIYGTTCTFVAPESGTYVFSTTEKTCQLDFYDVNDEYIESCFKGHTFEIELEKDEEIYFHVYYLNNGFNYIFIGDVNFKIENK